MKVSVIVLSYNSAATIGRALDSVLSQRCDFDWEIIVGDDGSTDATCEIVEKYARGASGVRFRMLFSKKNRGVQANYFDCLEAAAGEYIADCAADDSWVGDTRLKSFVDALDSCPEASMAFSNWTTVDAISGERRECFPAVTRDVERYEMLVPLLAGQSRPAMHLSACVYRKSSLMNDYSLHRDDLYRNKEYGCEDFQILMSLTCAGKGIYLPESTLDYSIGGNTITSQHDAARAARFALCTLKLRLKLAARHGLIAHPSVAESLARQYHYALSEAVAGFDESLLLEAKSLWRSVPGKPLRTLLLRLLLFLPGGSGIVRGLKNILVSSMF
ncbi:MAG: glycosyltransferase [Muribaculaceae bacterium]|nr:glycosyltransferase [Muribaculaceae bacterium]